MSIFDDRKNFFIPGEDIIYAKVEMNAVGKPKEYINIRMKELARSLCRMTIEGKIAEKFLELLDEKFFEYRNLPHCEIQVAISNKAIDDFVKLIDFKILKM